MEPTAPADAAPAVSIVVPCFNGGRYIDGLMDALARQTFRNFETIFVDDGSTDELTVRKLAELGERARVIRQPNRGASAARNTGAREARADILFMLDCDDTIEPTFLAEVVPVMQNAPPDVGMVATHMRLVGVENGVVPRYFNRFDLLFTNTLSPGLTVRKSSWRTAGGYDETMRQGYEDWDFSLRLVRAGFRGIEVAKPLYVYLVVGDDQVSSLSSSVHKKRLYALLWRQVRSRHPEIYRPIAIMRLWWSTRDNPGRIPLWKGLAGLILAFTLPDTIFNQLFTRLHRRRLPAQPRAIPDLAPRNAGALLGAKPARRIGPNG